MTESRWPIPSPNSLTRSNLWNDCGLWIKWIGEPSKGSIEAHFPRPCRVGAVARIWASWVVSFFFCTWGGGGGVPPALARSRADNLWYGRLLESPLGHWDPSTPTPSSHTRGEKKVKYGEDNQDFHIQSLKDQKIKHRRFKVTKLKKLTKLRRVMNSFCCCCHFT